MTKKQAKERLADDGFRPRGTTQEERDRRKKIDQAIADALEAEEKEE